MMEYWKEKKKETDCSPMPPGGTKDNQTKIFQMLR